MNVRELMAKLADTNADRTVLFLDPHADSDETDEIHCVDVREEEWTFESGFFSGCSYEVRYPGPPIEDGDPDRTNVVCEIRQVVVLSPALTNLRYWRP